MEKKNRKWLQTLWEPLQMQLFFFFIRNGSIFTLKIEQTATLRADLWETCVFTLANACFVTVRGYRGATTVSGQTAFTLPLPYCTPYISTHTQYYPFNDGSISLHETDPSDGWKWIVGLAVLLCLLPRSLAESAGWWLDAPCLHTEVQSEGSLQGALLPWKMTQTRRIYISSLQLHKLWRQDLPRPKRNVRTFYFIH